MKGLTMLQLRPRTALAAGIVLGGVAFGGFGAFAGDSPAPLTVTVTASGTLQPSKDLSLNFPAAGRLVDVDVRPGEQVSKGEPLAKVDPTSAQANLRTALASLASARARLLQLEGRLTPPERRQNRAARRRAELTAAQAQDSLRLAREATDANIAARADALDRANAKLAAAQADLATAQQTLSDASAKVADLKAQVATVQSRINSNEQQKAGLDGTQSSLQTQLQAAQDDLQTDQASLQNAQQRASTACAADPSNAACASATADVTAAQARVDGDRARISDLRLRLSSTQSSIGEVGKSITSDGNSLTDLNAKLADANGAYNEAKSAAQTAQGKVDAANDAVISAQDGARSGNQQDAQTLLTARNAVASAKLGVESTLADNAAKTQSGKAGDLQAARTAVDAAQATLANAREGLAATTLRAPADGTVATVNGTVGELTGSGGGSAFITLVDLGTYDVNVLVDEIDVAHIHPGQQAKVTISGADVRLTATVAAVDTLPTTDRSGVRYGVRLVLDGNDPTLRPGMTAEATFTLRA